MVIYVPKFIPMLIERLQGAYIALMLRPAKGNIKGEFAHPFIG